MIRHNVLFKIKSTASNDAIDNAYRLLFGLKKHLPDILGITGGKCRFHKNRDESDRLYGFSIDFANEEAYKAFLNDPLTHPAKMAIINITVDGYEGIFGFDIGKTVDTFQNQS